MSARMKRREFITLLGGASAWPLAASAQQTERVRRVGVLFGATATDRPEVAAFAQALQQLGWIDGRNLKTEYRSGCKVRDEDHNLFARRSLQIAPEQYRTLDRLLLGALGRTGRAALSQDRSDREPDDCRGG